MPGLTKTASRDDLDCEQRMLARSCHCETGLLLFS